jgi:NAD(P)-dependent dehydrogenase (short-subunit alcohol dehydrogenase family)
MEFTDKVVVITGAASGIGRATATLFAEEEAKVVLVDKEEEALHKTVVELGLQENQYLALVADVSREEEVIKYVTTVIETYGTIDVFFNNAGVDGKVSSLIDVTAEEFTRVLSVNVHGMFYGLKHIIPIMLKKNKGAIINTASVAALKVEPNMAPYAASKHAVIGLTKSAAIEYSRNNIRVNAICPGPIRTNMTKAFEDTVLNDPKNVGKSLEDIISQFVPIGRFGEAQEVAKLVKFLASEQASYITGGVYTIDGGVSN